MTPEGRRTNPEGVDYSRVMQVTLILTSVVGVPVVSALSAVASLRPGDHAASVIRVDTPVWLVTAVAG